MVERAKEMAPKLGLSLVDLQTFNSSCWEKSFRLIVVNKESTARKSLPGAALCVQSSSFGSRCHDTEGSVM